MIHIQENTLELERVTSIVKRLGHPASTLVLDSPCCIFNIPEVDGLIGYQLVQNCAVVMGDPVCLPQDLATLTQAFHHYCQEHNWPIIYLLASESFAHWTINNKCCRTLIQVGEELSLDPTTFQKKQKLRWKINQSIHSGVLIKEYQHFDPSLENQIKTTIQTWEKTKQTSQIYLETSNLFPVSENKRIFYAAQGEKIVGLLVLSEIDRSQGWVVTTFFATCDAPVGVTEHLMTSVFDTLASENCHFLCLGAISGSKLGEIVGLDIVSRVCAHLIFGITKWFFHFDTRKIYFDKYHPMRKPTYLLCSGKLSSRELLALKKIVKH